MYLQNIYTLNNRIDLMSQNPSFTIQLIDILSIIISSIIAYLSYFGLEQWPMATRYHIAILLGVLLSLVIFPLFKVHRAFNVHQLYGCELFSSIHRLFMAWFTVIMVLILIAFSMKVSALFSRVWIVSWAILGGVTLLTLRMIVFQMIYLINRQGWHNQKIVVVGAQQLGQTLVQRIQTLVPYTCVNVVAFFDDNKALHGQLIENVPVKGNISRLGLFIKEHDIDEVWITAESIEQSYLEKILDHLRYNSVTVRFVPNIFSFRLINSSVTQSYGLPVISLTESPMTNDTNRFLKAVEDKLLASLILLLISPLMLGIALGVKLTSPGPIFFRQERVGWNGKPFMMLKFRSMPINVEQETGPVWAQANENRATRFGQFLRKTSLDELPQFINVLLGDMSIVGPRPERPHFVEQFKAKIPNYMQKHLVKAGITGWAQVNGWRGNTDLKKRIEHDIYYIEHWSIGFDLQIILTTIFKVFFDQNAY